MGMSYGGFLMSYFDWTDERLDRLKKLRQEGLSAAKIAVQLGCRSRNAVMGKIYRLKLEPLTPRPTSAPRRSRRGARVTNGTSHQTASGFISRLAKLGPPKPIPP